jgi:hypothetical protein
MDLTMFDDVDAAGGAALCVGRAAAPSQYCIDKNDERSQRIMTSCAGNFSSSSSAARIQLLPALLRNSSFYVV